MPLSLAVDNDEKQLSLHFDLPTLEKSVKIGHIQKCSLFTDESTTIKVTFFSLPVFFSVMSSKVVQHDNVWLLYQAPLHERPSTVDTKMRVFRSEKGKLSRWTLTSEGLIFERAF